MAANVHPLNSSVEGVVGLITATDRVAPGHDEARDGDRLVEAIVCNIDRLALDTAIVMSGACLLRNPDCTLNAAALAEFLPAQEGQLAILMRALHENMDDLPALPGTAPFIEALHHGRDAITDFAHDEAGIGVDRARILNGERITVLWQQACLKATVLIEESNLDLRLRLPLIFGQNAAVLLSLLACARNGLRPCVDELGNLFSPQLPQQRRWPRQSILQKCTVEHGGAIYDSFAVDVSAGGLGLKNLPAIAVNSSVRIEMENGRVFSGKIAWSKDGRAGIQFHAPLLQTDPLLAG